MHRGLALALLVVLAAPAHAATEPLKPHAAVVEEVVAFLMSDVGENGILTMDDDPDGEPVPPYFYHYAIQHTDNLRSATNGYPGYASISYPGYTMAIAIDAFLGWWLYSGDPEGLARAVECADWLVDRRTPATDLYGNWVYSTQTDGVMGGGYDIDAVMSDKPGMFGTRLLRLYDITGDTRYFDAAVEIGATYRDTQLEGPVEDDGRWPFRVRPSDGLVRQDYTSHLVPAIRLLEELEERRPGQGFGDTAARAWSWLENNPMDPASASYQRWEGFYEDIGPESAGLRDHYSAEATAEALLERGAPGDLEKAIEIRDWSTDVFFAPDGVQNGNGVYTWALLEWQAWMNSTYAATAQWGVLHLRLDRAARGTALHDPTWREAGLQALHNLTWGQAPASSVPTDDGRMLTTIRELTQPSFGRETWYEQNFNTVLYLLQAFDLEPSLAPDDEGHLLGVDGAEPTSLLYAPGSITADFGGPGQVRAKLAAEPAAVFVDGAWIDSTDPRWDFDPSTQVFTLDHSGGRVVFDRAGNATDAPSSVASIARLDVAPNPFNPRTTISWSLERERSVRVRVVDARGRHVRWIARAAAARGSAVWNGRDDAGAAVASGAYHVIATNGAERVVRAVGLVR
ncbi:MAG TPA: hypothetical protein VKA86_05740 [Candidatus Krumholzibacteria bacterium]|nr:hypothetical protein [Candidatus Krumholzibacteria bacterium]